MTKASQREYARNRRDFLRSHGICVQCGRHAADDGRVYCRSCLDKYAVHNTRRRRRYCMSREDRVKKNLCWICGVPSIGTVLLCAYHHEASRANGKKAARLHMPNVLLCFQCRKKADMKFNNLGTCKMRQARARQNKEAYHACRDCDGAVPLEKPDVVDVAIAHPGLKQQHSFGVSAKTESPKQSQKKIGDNFMQQNGLIELNELLFGQLRKISDPKLQGEDLTVELKRANGVSSLAGQIITNANLLLKARQAMDGSLYREDYPKILIGNGRAGGNGKE